METNASFCIGGTEVKPADNAALVAQVVERDDGTVRRHRRCGVLAGERGPPFRRQPGRQWQGRLKLVQQVHRDRRVVDHHAAMAVGSAGAFNGFQFHGSRLSSSCDLMQPETTRSSTSVSHASAGGSRDGSLGETCPLEKTQRMGY
jgi:hypothetical protein